MIISISCISIMINKLIFLQAVLLLVSISNLTISCGQNNKDNSSVTFSTNQSNWFPITYDSFSRQVIVAFGINQNSTQGFLYGLEDINGRWALTFDTVSCEFGTKGIAQQGEKMEGDGKTPCGQYLIGPAFGYDKDIPSSLEFIVLTDNQYWVTDSNSEYYNQLVDFHPQGLDFEKMKRGDYLYKYGIIVQYNTKNIVKGKGSAIFIHVERGHGMPTAGCIAMSEANIKKLIQWADPFKKPSIIIGNIVDTSFSKTIPIVNKFISPGELLIK